jgi:hypothetical protein
MEQIETDFALETIRKLGIIMYYGCIGHTASLITDVQALDVSTWTWHKHIMQSG